jgi:hypothetical protein
MSGLIMKKKTSPITTQPILNTSINTHLPLTHRLWRKNHLGLIKKEAKVKAYQRAALPVPIMIHH